MRDNETRDPIFTSSVIDPDDVDQEFELRKLEGRPVSRETILKEWSHDELVLFGDDDLVTGEPVFQGPSKPSFDVIQRLYEWAQSQDARTRSRVLEFLDNPEEHLQEILLYLRKTGRIDTDAYYDAQADPADSFTALVRRLFRKNGRMTLTELNALAYRELPDSARPMNTLGMVLKRLATAGEIANR